MNADKLTSFLQMLRNMLKIYSTITFCLCCSTLFYTNNDIEITVTRCIFKFQGV